MAGEVCGCPVKVWLVDWSEWRSRSPLWGTVEHEARTEGRWLRRERPGPAVRWEKDVRETGTSLGGDRRPRQLLPAFQGVVDSMSPNPIEVQLEESGDKDAYWNDLRYRLSDINADLHIALEQVLATVLRLTASRFMREAHDLMVLFEALPPTVQADLLSRLSVADLRWAEQWRSAASYSDALAQSADEGTTRHLGLITTDVADYTARMATGYAVGVVAYAAAVIDVGDAVVEMILELSRPRLRSCGPYRGTGRRRGAREHDSRMGTRRLRRLPAAVPGWDTSQRMGTLIDPTCSSSTYVPNRTGPSVWALNEKRLAQGDGRVVVGAISRLTTRRTIRSLLRGALSAMSRVSAVRAWGLSRCSTPSCSR